MNGLKKRLVGKTIAMTIGITSLVGVAGVGPANAATVTNSGACSGAATYPQAVGMYLYGDVVTMNRAIVAYRAPCFAGAQTVTAVLRTWGYDPTRGWVFDWTVSQSVVLQPNQYGNLALTGAYFAKHWNVSVDVTLTWRTSTGQLIGQKYIDYNAVSDYFCAVASGGYRDCVVYSDPTVGAYIHFV